jgi:hypothetical protein
VQQHTHVYISKRHAHLEAPHRNTLLLLVNGRQYQCLGVIVAPKHLPVLFFVNLLAVVDGLKGWADEVDILAVCCLGVPVGLLVLKDGYELVQTKE